MRRTNLLTIKDAAEFMQVTRLTVYRAIYSGRLKAFKVQGGKLWRIFPSDLRRFARGGK